MTVPPPVRRALLRAPKGSEQRWATLVIVTLLGTVVILLLEGWLPSTARHLTEMDGIFLRELTSDGLFGRASQVWYTKLIKATVGSSVAGVFSWLLALHALTAGALWLFARKFVGSSWIASATALSFFVLPPVLECLRIEYICEMLLGLSFLGVLTAHLARRESTPGLRHLGWLAAEFGFVLLGYTAKESFFIYVPMLLLADLLCPDGPRATGKRALGDVARSLWPHIAIATLVFASGMPAYLVRLGEDAGHVYETSPLQVVLNVFASPIGIGGGVRTHNHRLLFMLTWGLVFWLWSFCLGGRWSDSDSRRRLLSPLLVYVLAAAPTAVFEDRIEPGYLYSEAPFLLVAVAAAAVRRARSGLGGRLVAGLFVAHVLLAAFLSTGCS